MNRPAVGLATRSARNRAWPPSWSGWVSSSGIGNHLPLGLGAANALGPAGLVMLAALLAVEVATVGAAGDRPSASAGLGGVAFAMQLHHYPRAKHRVVLGAAHPLGQLTTRPRPHRELTVVERHKHRVKARHSRLPGVLVGGLGGALPDGLGVAGRHAQPVAGEGFAQRRPGGAQLLSGGVDTRDTAQPLSQRKCAFGLGPVGKEAAGLPAHPPLEQRQVAMAKRQFISSLLRATRAGTEGPAGRG